MHPKTHLNLLLGLLLSFFSWLSAQVLGLINDEGRVDAIGLGPDFDGRYPAPFA